MKRIIEFFKISFHYSVKAFLLLLSVILIFSILFIAIRYINITSLESEKLFVDDIPYFNIILYTSFRTNGFEDVLDGSGRLYYQLYLKGKVDKYSYDNYDYNYNITIYFLDEDGFKISEEQFQFKDFTKIVDKKRVIGFMRKGYLYENYKDYKKYSYIDVTWACEFNKK